MAIRRLNGPCEAPPSEKLLVTPIETGDNIDPRTADALNRILSIFIIRDGKYSVYPRAAALKILSGELLEATKGLLLAAGTGAPPPPLHRPGRRTTTLRLVPACLRQPKPGIPSAAGTRTKTAAARSLPKTPW
jgi:hypothetical protein